jgi:hypothetical protein
MDKTLQQTTRMSDSSTDSREKMSEQPLAARTPGASGADSLAQTAEKDKPSAPEYPPQGKRIVIVISLYLALFLNTLVRANAFQFHIDGVSAREVCAELTCPLVGPKHHLNSDPRHHERIQLDSRYRLVWLCVSPHNMRLPAAHGQGVQVLQSQAAVHHECGVLRDWLCCLWCRS